MTEPELKCQLYKYEVPEVMCEDQTRRQCTDLAHLQPDTVSLHLDTAAPDYQGHCQPRSLALSQKVKKWNWDFILPIYGSLFCFQECKVQPQQTYSTFF